VHVLLLVLLLVIIFRDDPPFSSPFEHLLTTFHLDPSPSYSLSSFFKLAFNRRFRYLFVRIV
jgi:hypothetical protein